MQQNKAQKVIEEVKKAFIGKTECVEKLMTAILAGGHVLVEDVPGVGKTTLALAFAKAMNVRRTECSLHRMFYRLILQALPYITGKRMASFTVPAQSCAIFFWRMRSTVPPLRPRRRFWR